MLSPPSCYNLFWNNFFDFDVPKINLNFIERTIEDIKETLGLQVYPPENLKIIYVPQLSGKSSEFVRGKYFPLQKVIALSNKGCRKTLIHELLHSFSSFLRIPALYEKVKKESYLIDGLTEFLTGYVLFTKYHDCYEKWIDEFSFCALSYKPYVKIFGATAQVIIPIEDLAEIYIYNPHRDWFNLYDNFLREYGLEDFLIEKPKKRKKISSDNLFLNTIKMVIRNRFGQEKLNEFNDLLKEAPITEVLDYSKMLKKIF